MAINLIFCVHRCVIFSWLGPAMASKTHNQPIPSEMGGVIWITGYSGSGKTTVGRKVIALLEERGVRPIHLDGDDLRSIFADQWGYERKDRVELAHVYFRLCSHLVSQGMHVVISAAAMYDEVRTWVQSIIPNSFVAYLRVPEEERRRRDENTKQIYRKLSKLSDLYDEPADVNLIIENYAPMNPDVAADTIVRHYLEPREQSADKGKAAHWDNFYSNNTGVLEPSAFAQTVSGMITRTDNILEIGCGNGRDSIYFASLGHQVVALDTSEAAIELCREVHKKVPVAFLGNSIDEFKIKSPAVFDCVYSRFVLHAMTFEEEDAFLDSSWQLLKADGKILLECRSILDPLAREGEVISPTERICGHYRRFIVQEALLKSLNHKGFDIISCEESKGLATFGKEDPVVIRLVAKKK